MHSLFIGNSGCGIWILDGSHPLVHSNQIIYSGSNGIAFVSSSDVEHDRQFESQTLQNDAVTDRQVRWTNFLDLL